MNNLFKGVITVGSTPIPVNCIINSVDPEIKRLMENEYDRGAKRYIEELIQIYHLDFDYYSFPGILDNVIKKGNILTTCTGVVRYGEGQPEDSGWFDKEGHERVLFYRREEEKTLCEKGAGRRLWGDPSEFNGETLDGEVLPGHPFFYLISDCQNDNSRVIFDTEMFRGGELEDEMKRDFNAALLLKALARKEKVEIKTLTPLAALKPNELPLYDNEKVSLEEYNNRIGERKYDWSNSDVSKKLKALYDNQNNTVSTKQKIPKDVLNKMVFYYYGVEIPEMRLKPQIWIRSNEEKTDDYIKEEVKQNILKVWKIQDSEEEKNNVAEKITKRIGTIVGLAHKYDSTFSSYHQNGESIASSLNPTNITILGEVIDLDTFKSKILGDNFNEHIMKVDFTTANNTVLRLCSTLDLDPIHLTDYFRDVYNDVRYSPKISFGDPSQTLLSDFLTSNFE